MHISSLPSNYGIGTFGKAAYDFIDFLHQSKVKVWQILPLNLTSFGDSPYQSPASFSINYYFIDLDILISEGLLNEDEVKNADLFDSFDRVNYGKQYNERIRLLEVAYSRFKENNEFKKFLKLDEYAQDVAFFMTLKKINNFKPWYDFDNYRDYSLEIENLVKSKYEKAYKFYMRTQFEAKKQYKSIKKYANKKDVLIMGDIPFYVGYDSVECYKYSKYFKFNKKKEPVEVAGCPPDFFSKTGQLWGNPIYNWKAIKEDNYEWFNKRFKFNFELYDIVRLDHFRGYSGFYSIPGKDKTAENGKWKKGPGFDLFKDKLNLDIVAEDLGFLDEEFYKFYKKLPYPGMKIIPEGLTHPDFDDVWRPHNVSNKFLLYTSTHDSPLVSENLDLKEDEKKRFLLSLFEECKALNVEYPTYINKDSVIDAVIEVDFASNALISMISMQDLLHLGKEGRMNLPSSLSTSNWSWRMKIDEFLVKKEAIINQLKSLNIKYKR